MRVLNPVTMLIASLYRQPPQFREVLDALMSKGFSPDELTCFVAEATGVVLKRGEPSALAELPAFNERAAELIAALRRRCPYCDDKGTLPDGRTCDCVGSQPSLMDIVYS